MLAGGGLFTVQMSQRHDGYPEILREWDYVRHWATTMRQRRSLLSSFI